MRCYCSICRKVAGGFAINIMGEWDSLQLEGRERPCEYRVLLPDGAAPGKLAPSSNACFFCGECGRHLYPREEAYTSWFYPFAGCVDSALPVCHVLLDSKAGWVAPHARRGDEEHDTVADLGFASELAHYAEYSGGPSTAETYGFARKLFGAAKAAPDGRGRALIVGGGAAVMCSWGLFWL
jgi:hypothetical protein